MTQEELNGFSDILNAKFDAYIAMVDNMTNASASARTAFKEKIELARTQTANEAADLILGKEKADLLAMLNPPA